MFAPGRRAWVGQRWRLFFMLVVLMHVPMRLSHAWIYSSRGRNFSVFAASSTLLRAGASQGRGLGEDRAGLPRRLLLGGCWAHGQGACHLVCEREEYWYWWPLVALGREYRIPPCVGLCVYLPIGRCGGGTQNASEYDTVRVLRCACLAGRALHGTERARGKRHNFAFFFPHPAAFCAALQTSLSLPR